MTMPKTRVTERLDARDCKHLRRMNQMLGLNKSLYDPYIRAFRWSTDRLDPIQGGVIAFVSKQVG